MWVVLVKTAWRMPESSVFTNPYIPVFRLSFFCCFFTQWKWFFGRTNLKIEVTRKQSTPNFPKKRTFLISWHLHVGGKKCSFFGKFGGLCFLVTSILRFAYLPDSAIIANLNSRKEFMKDRGVFGNLSNI